MTSDFHLIVLTPPGQLDPAVAIAASRAGEIGVLDLEYAPDHEAARRAAARLAQYARGSYGLKFHCQHAELLPALIENAPAHLRLVLLTGSAPQLLQQHVEAIHAKNLIVLLEATNLHQARLGEELGVEGIIAKGNEAGGYVGEETTFVLLQKFLTRLSLPVYAQGGIGLHTAAACYAAGAAGVVLDSQLALAREAHLPAAVRDRIAVMDGSETLCLGGRLDERCRIYFRPGHTAVEALRREEEHLTDSHSPSDEEKAAWREAVRRRVERADPNDPVLLLGQDAAFAAPLARRFATVSGVLAAIRKAIASHCESAARLRSLDEGAPLARSHGTRYPILQGPMTRVSDKADFALEVAQAGGLPFLALALMPKAEVIPLLEQTRQALGVRPWGVGILGFVPQAVRQEQLDAIRSVRPAFALIAGGRPDQATGLEQDGIATYLHVPSPGLLRMFLAQGARRFVFEGRECGGHVGPRSSFVLWETMIDVLLEHLAAAKEDAQVLHVVFAGGIHDALSSAMVAALVAPLADLGARVGVLMGTAYLFTQEAVKTGAIVPGYQAEALRGEQTVLLESSPGHATRCLSTPFARAFTEHKRRLTQEQVIGDHLRDALEALNLGRLRIATKGIVRHPRFGLDSEAPRHVKLDQAEQHEQGMYMIGQATALRDRVTTVQALHEEVSIWGAARLAALIHRPASSSDEPVAAQPWRIAIVGMACILPKASNLQTYWDNILDKVDAVTEVPRERWDWERYYDTDRAARDKIYSRWGGFIHEVPFNPLDYGMPPNSVPAIEPLQLLMLDVVRAGLADAGYLDRPFPRERTAVVVGVGGGLGDLGYLYGFRSYLPHFLGPESSEVISRLAEKLPEWTEDSFPGILLNVVAGRIANRFDLGGPNFTVDAACASSLAALDVAVKDLASHRTDMAIVGAADTVQSPFAFLAFSKTQALSPTGRCRPFDANADGIAISEGLAVVVLKRLDDAERDGDRIYAVIQGIGASSDGKDKGLTAPRPAGQLRALRRAYGQAGVSPDTVGLIEAHGTGTRVGDAVELEALTDYFGPAHVGPMACAVGSVKSMIGHTKSTAGLAGLIKVALALHHKILPPTLVDRPNPGITSSQSLFYVNNEARPWMTGAADTLLRAGVSAFGFGGTNFHAVLEEYPDGYLPTPASRQTWSSELLLWRGQDRGDLLNQLHQLEGWLSGGNEPPLRDIAYSLYFAYRRPTQNSPDGVVLAIVAVSLDDLKEKLAHAKSKLGNGEAAIHDPRGTYFAELAADSPGGAARIAFLFPGQGSQYPNMLRDLALQFPQVRASLQRANHVLTDRLPKPLSDYIFPVPAYTEVEAQASRGALTATRIAQPALGAVELALSCLLKEMDVRPEFAAGHSYGEIVALCEAGVIGISDLYLLSEARGRMMAEVTGQEPGTMAAVNTGRDLVATVIQGLHRLTLANINSPHQTVISGPRADVEQAVQRFQAQGIEAQALPVACAFHSPLVAPAAGRLAELLATLELRSPEIQVFSNTTGGPYPAAPDAIRERLSEHLLRPVEFQKEVEAMYAAGARIFVEIGPRSVLSTLVGHILADRPHQAIPVDQRGSSGLMALQKALGQLAAAGVPLKLDSLFEGRAVTRLDFDQVYTRPDQTKLGPATWLLSGGRARPWRDTQQEQDLKPLKVQLASDNVPAEARSPKSADFGTVGGSPESPDFGSHQGASADEVTQVILQYQQLMSHFLETQKNIMLAYLRVAPAPDAPEADRTRDVLPTLSAPLAPQRANQVMGSPLTSEPAPAATSPPNPPPAPESSPPLRAQANDSQVGDDRLSPLTAETLTRELVAIVSERTGYPAEMLGLDADLEADLGIDSIKRVEILGTLRQRQPRLQPLLAGQAMEQLQAQKTLRAIAGWISAHVDGRDRPQPSPAAVHNANESVSPAAPGTPILRFMLSSVESPLNGSAEVRAPARVIVLTDDGRGVARAVASILRGQGNRVALVTGGHDSVKTDPNRFTADLTSADSVARLLGTIRQDHGPIGGLLHLAPLADHPDFGSLGFADSREMLRREILSLFHLIRGLYDDFASTAQSGGARLLAATDMGGDRNRNGHTEPDPSFPGRSGIAALLKSVAHELPGVRVQVADLDLRYGVPLAVQAILNEWATGDDQIEVHYDGLSRKTLQLAPSPLNGTGPASLALDSRSVILVTGGARGITAQVAHELAARYRPTLLLVGRSPLPPPDESPPTAGLTSATSVKAALVAALSRNGHKPSLGEVEAAYGDLLREREIRANLRAMQRTGATVEYHPVDVRDEATFGALIDHIYRTFGQLDGVIHGAGVIEDKLIKDKTPESFERVFSTKVDSAFIISRRLRPESLKFLAFFSSISGRFGNKGQGDYAAANEVLNKLAVYLDRLWPARVVSINWGPWDAPGMVSAEVRQEFQRRGVSLIPPAAGVRMFVEELNFGRKGEVEVIISGADERAMARR